MEKKIIEKDKTYYVINKYIALLGMVYILLMPFFDSWHFRIGPISIKAFLFLSLPICLVGLVPYYYVFVVRNNPKARIIIDEHGILIEEFKNTLFPWEEIKDISIRTLKGQQGLVIHTRNDQKYVKEKIYRTNKRFGYTGVTVCNLTNYKTSSQEVRDIFTNGVRNRRR